MGKIIFLFFSIGIFLSVNLFSQTTLNNLTFESTGGYSTSVSEFTDGSYDYFTRTDGSNIGSVDFTNIQGSYYFAAQDIDGLGGPSEVTLLIDDVDISEYNNIQLKVFIAEDDDGSDQDWDASDFVHFDYDIDNSGSFSSAIHIESSGGTNTEPAIDSNFDGIGDGAAITNTFAQFTANITGTGSLIDIRITFDLDSGDEDIAIDNVELVGTAANGVFNPTNALATVISESQIDLSWIDNPNSDNVLLAYNTSDSFGDPQDGTTYSNGDNIGTAIVLQYSSSDSYSHSSLDSYLTYYYKLWSYDGSEYSPGIELNAQTLPDLIITEIMNNPSAVTDADGEWFEIYNASSSTVDIDGYVIKDAGTDSHTIDNSGALNISAGGFLVLGDNADTGTNGDLTVDYEYSGITMANTSDELMLYYSDGSTIIDQVTYDDGATFPDPEGASMFLEDFTTDNDAGSNWGTSSLREGTFSGASGDFGSPGALGSDAALPVELTSFTANYNEDDNAIELNWETATEVNNAGFEVHRSSIDNQFNEGEFDVVHFERGNGTVNSPRYYEYTDSTFPIAEKLWYRLKQIDNDGAFAYSKVRSVELSAVTSVDDDELNYELSLAQNYPNPFNPTTIIKYTIPTVETGHAPSLRTKLIVYDILGQQIKTLVNEVKSPGNYEVVFNASQLHSGVYFYTLNYGEFTQTRKLLLIK